MSRMFTSLANGRASRGHRAVAPFRSGAGWPLEAPPLAAHPADPSGLPGSPLFKASSTTFFSPITTTTGGFMCELAEWGTIDRITLEYVCMYVCMYVCIPFDLRVRRRRHDNSLFVLSSFFRFVYVYTSPSGAPPISALRGPRPEFPDLDLCAASRSGNPGAVL
jgi:hypothetical protein